jgi:hypothetical protein
VEDRAAFACLSLRHLAVKLTKSVPREFVGFSRDTDKQDSPAFAMAGEPGFRERSGYFVSSA